MVSIKGVDNMIDSKFLTFLSLCETRNYTKTAELLYVTQPSVTNHIKSLEKIYNIKLFTSNTKNFKLTPEGELLYKYVLQLKALDAQFDRILAATESKKDQITFSVTKNIVNGYLKYVLSNWSKNNKDINYCLNVKEYEEILEELNQGLIDFAIIDNRFNKKNYQVIQLHKTSLVLAVNKKHPLAKFSKVSFDQLTKERIVLDIKGTGKRDFLESELKLHNRSIKDLTNLIEINCPKTICDLVKTSEFVSVFYRSEIEDEIKSGKLIPIEIVEVNNFIDFSLIFNKNHLSTKFIEKIAQDFSKLYNEVNYLKYTSS